MLLAKVAYALRGLKQYFDIITNMQFWIYKKPAEKEERGVLKETQVTDNFLASVDELNQNPTGGQEITHTNGPYTSMNCIFLKTNHTF